MSIHSGDYVILVDDEINSVTKKGFVKIFTSKSSFRQFPSQEPVNVECRQHR
ncbi:hypothetical protein PPTG_23739 [Phytophthora nicotianae INRA-310]|uniref:Uncharacterized protein n=1 Tax=Phytophthora nicotianae (strain INRA-310) TaxID=761204 RepID=W2PRX8_PHYN3|nr:hypothetical protein PPTG_23739 [Phytophthora nicotianae INRA-310]ETN03718.1 hypothetical protein PPTG_23739 [Phytophthora nicotianae INRA-310]